MRNSSSLPAQKSPPLGFPVAPIRMFSPLRDTGILGFCGRNCKMGGITRAALRSAQNVPLLPRFANRCNFRSKAMPRRRSVA